MRLRANATTRDSPSGSFAARPLRPGPWRVVKHVLLMLLVVLGAVVGVMAIGQALPGFGASNGTVTDLRCVPDGRGEICHGTWHPDPDGSGYDGDRVQVEGMEANEPTRAVFGGDGSDHITVAATVGGRAGAVFLACVGLAMVTSLLVGLVAWPLRAAVHVVNPGWWPRYVVAPAGTTGNGTAQRRRRSRKKRNRTRPSPGTRRGLPARHPPVIALGMRVLTWWLCVLAAAGGLGMVVYLGYSLTGPR